jgi:uncharacterized membrane protein
LDALRQVAIPWYSLLPWLVIGLGVALRVDRFLFDRSLWTDEAALAINIVRKPITDFLQPLDYNQAAPLGFLLVEKLFVSLLGNTEYALRLFPLLCSLIALIALYNIARPYLTPTTTAVAIGLLAISPFTLYYSTEVKQYSSDIAAALLAVWLALNAHSKPHNVRGLALLAVFGIGAVWFSFTVLLVLAGIGLSLGLDALWKKDWVQLRNLLLICVGWAASFGVYYLTSLRLTLNNNYLVTYWNAYFLPLAPFDPAWLVKAFSDILEDPGGLPADISAVLLCIGGLSLLWKNKFFLLVLIAPIFVNLAASALRKYPFGERLILFAIPFLFLLIAEGIDRLGRSVK